MKRSILAAAAILAMAGAVRAADFGDLSGKTAQALKTAAVKETALVQVPEPQLTGAAKDFDFDIRKVFLMPGTETWEGPFTVQFAKEADLEKALDILKRTGLENNAKELADNGRGLYAKIEMGDEFAWVKVMQLVDYTSVRSVQVNQRLWNK